MRRRTRWPRAAASARQDRHPDSKDTYVWDHLILDCGRQRNVAEEESGVDLEKGVSVVSGGRIVARQAGPPAAKLFAWHASFWQTVRVFWYWKGLRSVGDGTGAVLSWSRLFDGKTWFDPANQGPRRCQGPRSANPTSHSANIQRHSTTPMTSMTRRPPQ